ncbi:putative 5xTM membrane BCR, YitT family [compost metagenome]
MFPSLTRLRRSPSPVALKSVEGPGASGAASPAQHQLHEDAQALLTGTLFVALGVIMFRHTGLLTGGTAGLAFLLHYATGWNFSLVFFLINLPFYGLAYKRMGWVFTLKTFAAVALLAVLAEWVPQWISFGTLSTGFAAIAGGLLMGAGMLMLFRHRASLGGFNVLVLYLQERFGWRAGQVQMAFDCTIVLAAFAVVDGRQILWSVVGAIVLNMTLAINHRPGRYMAV